MAKFAAHDDLSIYAIGDTPDDAIRNARDDAKDPSASFETTEISETLAAQIERDGWNGKRQSFEVLDGEIIETTNI